MKYRMTSTSEMGGQSAEFSNVLTSTVKEIRADGTAIVVSKTGEMALKVGGQDMSAMIPQEDVTVTAVMMPRIIHFRLAITRPMNCRSGPAAGGGP